MSKETVTFQLDDEKRAALDAIAAGLDRDRSDLINEAISLYLEAYEWQITEIRQSLVESEAGDFATSEEVKAVFAQLAEVEC